MIPLRDDQPTSTFPIVTVLLIAVNVLVFLGQQVLPLDSSFALVPYEVTHHVDIAHRVLRGPNGEVEFVYGPSPHPLWLTIFSSMFLHAGWLHIGGNMLYLWIFGNNIEDALGKVRYLLFYFVCGLAAGALQIATDPNSIVPNLGASGAIAGVLGAYLILYPDARVLSIVPIFGFGFLASIRAFWVLVLWVVVDVLPAFVPGLGEMQRGGGGVAYFAHLGGFAAGFLLITLMGGKRLVARQQRRAAYSPPRY